MLVGTFVSSPQIQPIYEKMRLEMLVEMQIEILDGGEILVSCTSNI